MFTKGAGEYTVGVATVKENKTSAITSIKYTYAESTASKQQRYL